MPDKKIIAVMGATGAQGGGLARAILNDPKSEFSLRVITRDVNSAKAKEFKEKGAEVLSADIDDLESLKRAFKGAYGAYCVTFYWAHFNPEKETAQAKNLAEAAKANNLQHVIWSTLEDTRKWIPLEDNRMPTLMGKYKVPHFDAKGEADKYFKNSGVPVTFLVASFYWENFIFFGSGPKKMPDGKLALVLPMGNKKLAGIAAEDIGKAAYGIFKNKNKYAGKYVGIASDHLTIKDIAEKFTNALNQEVIYNNVPPDVYRSFGFPGADDIGNMFQFYADFEEDGLKLRNINVTRELNPELQSFDEWLRKNKDRIPLG